MEKDDEVKGEGNSITFKNRIYDSRIGKWMSMDPLQKKYPWMTPYHYVRNSPIGKIDISGLWDIEVHAYKDRKRYGYAVLIVKNRMGKEVYRTTVRVHGSSSLIGGKRDITNGDTPQGKYKIGDDQAVWQKKKNTTSYGPNALLRLKYLGGEGGKRQYMHVHGGRQEGKNYKKYGKILWNTHGCMRIKDDEIKEIKNITQNLEEKDSEEKPGYLVLTDDLVELDGEYSLPVTDNATGEVSNKKTFWQGIKDGVMSWIDYFSSSSNDSVVPKTETKIDSNIKKTIDADGDGYTNMRPQIGGKGKATRINAGSKIKIIEKGEKASKIEYNGQQGYIYNKYIKQ